jgi:hypothetical protein
MSYYVHELPGRLRINIPSLKRNSAKLRKLQNFLEDFSGVDSTAANEITGSVVINYDQKHISSQQILRYLVQEGYLDVTEGIVSRKGMTGAVTDIGTAASRVLVGLAIERAFQGSPLALLASLI